MTQRIVIIVVAAGLAIAAAWLGWSQRDWIIAQLPQGSVPAPAPSALPEPEITPEPETDPSPAPDHGSPEAIAAEQIAIQAIHDADAEIRAAEQARLEQEDRRQTAPVIMATLTPLLRAEPFDRDALRSALATLPQGPTSAAVTVEITPLLEGDAGADAILARLNEILP